MKKIFTLSAILLFAVVLLSSCVKDHTVITNNENYWLSKEEGEVVYSDPYCNYWVVETYYGYTIVSSNAGSQPYEGDLLYGNFSNTGIQPCTFSELIPLRNKYDGISRFHSLTLSQQCSNSGRMGVVSWHEEGNDNF